MRLHYLERLDNVFKIDANTDTKSMERWSSSSSLISIIIIKSFPEWLTGHLGDLGLGCHGIQLSFGCE